jgi:hypothetical protein
METIDASLEPGDPLLVDCGLRHASGDPCGRVGEPRAKREQILLNRAKLRREVLRYAGRECGAETGVQLVDLAVRVDARVRLRHPCVVEERGLAAVAGLCVDLHAA